MPTTRIFKSGNSLAVRLPKEFAFEEGLEVEIRRQGASIVLTPTRLDMAFLIERLRRPIAGAAGLTRPGVKPPRRDWPGSDTKD